MCVFFVMLFVEYCCLVSCRLIDGCFLFVLSLRARCLFGFVCGLSLLAIVALCSSRAVVAYSCCLPFVVVCCQLLCACCVFVVACVL